MKRIIFLFALICALVSASAQENAAYDYKVGYAESWTSYLPVTVPNATTATDSVWFYTVLKESNKPLFYDIKLKLDSTGGTAKRTTIILQSKVWNSDSYATVATKYWVTGHDTTILFTNIVTPALSGTFEADSTMVFTSNILPKINRYWRIFVRNDTKGFITKIPEFSILFKEQ